MNWSMSGVGSHIDDTSWMSSQCYTIIHAIVLGLLARRRILCCTREAQLQLEQHICGTLVSLQTSL